MSLLNGDLTTLSRAENWISGVTSGSSTILQQLISAMSNQIYGKLNRGRIYSRNVVSTFDGTGTNQIVLLAYPVTSITQVQVGAAIIPASPLPNPTTGIAAGLNTGYGWRFVPWNGGLPGENCVLEFKSGYWWPGVQNIQVSYVAGYLIASEPQSVPASPGPYTVLVDQPNGIWSRDNGVVYASSGVALTPVTSSPTVGEYIPPSDSGPGLYTFSSFDSSAALLISYSFIPSDLEQACIQLVAESWKYSGRVGMESQMLGGQESVRVLRGGIGRVQMFPDLPPEVDALISPYVNVVPPALGAPV